MMGTYRRLLVLLSIGALVVVALPSISASEIEANAGADQIVRKGSMVSFMGSLNLPDPERTYTISWDFDADLDVDLDGNSTNDAESYDLYLQHVYEVPGCYTATLRIFDDIGNVYVDTVQITVLDNFSASDDVDPPESLMWNWSFGDGTSSTESPPTFHVYTDVRVYSCVVRVYDSENASDEMLVLVTTRGDNPPVIDITSPPMKTNWNQFAATPHMRDAF